MISLYFFSVLKKNMKMSKPHQKSVTILQIFEQQKDISKTIKQRKHQYIWSDDGKPVFQLLLFPAICNKCFILTGSFGFVVQAKAQVKTLDSAFQLVKQQNVSSVKQLRLNNPVSDNSSKGLKEEAFPYTKWSSSTPWCQKLPPTALGMLQCWSDRNR